MDLQDLVGVLLTQPLLLEDAEMVQALHILILGNVRKSGICHAQLLALVDVGRAPQAVDGSGQHLG